MIDKSKRASVQRRLLAEVGQRVKVVGFNPEPSGQSFYKDIPGGHWVLHLSFIPHKSDFDLTADIAIRIDAIEDLVNEYDSGRSAAEKKQSMTFGGELGNIAGTQQMRWTISSEDDIPTVADDVVSMFRKIGLPFLQSNSDMSSAYRVLTSAVAQDFHLAPILGPRYMRAVVTAYLLGDDEHLSSMVEEYGAELRSADDLYLDNFLSLCRGIREKRETITR